MRNSLKIIFANLGSILLVIALFDLAMYKLLPESYTAGFKEYRKAPAPEAPGHSKYPKDYFVEHSVRGFDIGPNRKSSHWVEGIDYPIWSNSLACFDNEHSEYERYVYFAGDSFTWGYAPFEQKFGTLVEQQTGTDILKCGVTHTGQRHQFEKFHNIVEQLDSPPKAVFVFYSSNDMANDYAHPHTAVVRGWLVESAALNPDNELIRFTDEELNQKIDDGLAKLERKHKLWWQDAAQPVLRYSLSANILNGISEKSQEFFENLKRRREPATVAKPAVQTNQATVAEHGTVTVHATKNLYLLPIAKNDRYWYRDNPYAENNKQALLDFKTYSDQKGIEYVVVLIPSKGLHTRTEWFRELREFFNDNDIQYLDLSSEFRERRLSKNDLYWVYDGHFSPAGNKIVADILIASYPEIFLPHSLTHDAVKSDRERP